MKKNKHILICEDCNSRNYQVNANLSLSKIKKYCSKCEKHTYHKISR